MLNPFAIQYLALLAHFLLRICVGSILVYLGLTHLQHRKSLERTFKRPWFPFVRQCTWLLIIGELLLGGLFLIGAHTQYAALILMMLCIDMMFAVSIFKHPSLPNRMFYILLFFTALSLFITGAGAFAVDLPI